MADLGRERRALELFEAMLELSEQERLGWLAEHTKGDPALRRRVTELADADKTHSVRTGGAFDHLDEVPPPERVGAYRLEELIGTGGMGSVYAARRDRGDFEHEVAIKLIKPGLLSDRLANRFARERQLLAQFSHPNIARLFDGGETDDGQPYIVMEKIDGEPLANWLEATSPDLATRIRLFVKICDAVSHAHRNLVIHRDLTPANILVDCEGEPRLIDFGIARPDGEEDVTNEAANAPALRNLTLTPGFAAPERLRGETATTLSDVYSAGRLLASLIPKPRPPEIQAIVNKAIAQQPNERYSSMDRLGEDVARFLASRPVEAMPANTTYLVRKWFGRNRMLGGVAVALAIAVILGVGGITWFANEERLARAEAERSFGETRAIAKVMMFDLYDELSKVPQSTRARHMLATTAQKYLESLAQESNSTDALFDAGQGYFRLAEVVGGRAGGGTLGRIDEAKPLYGRSREILSRLAKESPENTEISAALAKVLAVTADGALFNDGDYSTARRDALLARKIITGLPKLDDELAGALLSTYLQSGNALAWETKPEEAGAEYNAGLQIADELEGRFGDAIPVKQARADLLRMNGAYHSYFQRPDKARASLERSLNLQREIAIATGNAPRGIFNLVTILVAAAQIELRNGDRESSYAHSAEAVRLARKGVAENSDDAGMRQIFTKSALGHARLLSQAGQHRNAAAIATEAIAVRRRLAEDAGDVVGGPMTLAVELQQASQVLLGAGRTDVACDYIREALATMNEYRKHKPLPQANIDNNYKPMLLDLERCG